MAVLGLSLNLYLICSFKEITHNIHFADIYQLLRYNERYHILPAEGIKRQRALLQPFTPIHLSSKLLKRTARIHNI